MESDQSVFERVQDLLRAANAVYELHFHAPLATAGDGERVLGHAARAGTKSLALRMSRKRVVVVTIAGDQRIDFGALKVLLQTQTLTKASRTELWGTLGVAPGGVSPFGYDASVLLAVAESLGLVEAIHFSPGRPDATIRLSGETFLRIMVAAGARMIPPSALRDHEIVPSGT